MPTQHKHGLGDTNSLGRDWMACTLVTEVFLSSHGFLKQKVLSYSHLEVMACQMKKRPLVIISSLLLSHCFLHSQLMRKKDAQGKNIQCQ